MVETVSKRRLSEGKIGKFIASYTGISKYQKNTVDRTMAMINIIKTIIEDYGFDYLGYTYTHTWSFGGRLKRLRIDRFPLKIEPDLIRTDTTAAELFQDTGWFPADDNEVWPKIIQSILIEITNHLMPQEDIGYRLKDKE